MKNEQTLLFVHRRQTVNPTKMRMNNARPRPARSAYFEASMASTS